MATFVWQTSRASDDLNLSHDSLPIIKSGILFRARDKEATVLQRAFAVLLPQRLLLYDMESDFTNNVLNVVLIIDLQDCLAVQRTKDITSLSSFMLMIVPGGVKLFGCENTKECDVWIKQINCAMDMSTETPELKQIMKCLPACGSFENGLSCRVPQLVKETNRLPGTNEASVDPNGVSDTIQATCKLTQNVANSDDWKQNPETMVTMTSTNPEIASIAPVNGKVIIDPNSLIVVDTASFSKCMETEDESEINFTVSPRIPENEHSSDVRNPINDTNSINDIFIIKQSTLDSLETVPDNPTNGIPIDAEVLSPNIILNNCSKNNHEISKDFFSTRSEDICLVNPLTAELVNSFTGQPGLEQCGPSRPDSPKSVSNDDLRLYHNDIDYPVLTSTEYVCVPKPGAEEVIETKPDNTRNDEHSTTISISPKYKIVDDSVNIHGAANDSFSTKSEAMILLKAATVEFVETPQLHPKNYDFSSTKSISTNIVSDGDLLKNDEDTNDSVPTSSEYIPLFEQSTVDLLKTSPDCPNSNGAKTEEPISQKVISNDSLNISYAIETGSVPTVEDGLPKEESIIPGTNQVKEDVFKPVAAAGHHFPKSLTPRALSQQKAEKLQGCACFDNKDEPSEIDKLLQQTRPFLFDDTVTSGLNSLDNNSAPQESSVEAQTSISQEEQNTNVAILQEISVLTSMLRSQETAYSLLFDSCTGLKETITKLQRQLEATGASRCLKDASENPVSDTAIKTGASNSMSERPKTRRPVLWPSHFRQNSILRQRKTRSDQRVLYTRSLTEIELGRVDSDLFGSSTPSTDSLSSNQNRTDQENCDLTLVASSRNNSKLFPKNEITHNQSTAGHTITPITSELTSYSVSGYSVPCFHCIFSPLLIILEDLILLQPAQSVIQNDPSLVKRLQFLSEHLYAHLSTLLRSMQLKMRWSIAQLSSSVGELMQSAFGKEIQTRVNAEECQTQEEFVQMIIVNACKQTCSMILGCVDFEKSTSSMSTASNLNMLNSIPESKAIISILPEYILMSLAQVTVERRQHLVQKEENFEIAACIKLTSYGTDVNAADGIASVSDVQRALNRLWIEALEQQSHGTHRLTFVYQPVVFSIYEFRMKWFVFTPLFCGLLGKLQTLQEETNSFPEIERSSRQLNAIRLFESQLGSPNECRTNIAYSIAEPSKENGILEMEQIFVDASTQTEDERDIFKSHLKLTRSMDKLNAAVDQYLGRRKSETAVLDSDAEDYAHVVIALCREHQDEKENIWNTVRMHWAPREELNALTEKARLPIEDLHSHLNEQNRDNSYGGSCERLKGLLSLDNQDKTDQSLFILLRHLETATDTLADLLPTDSNESNTEVLVTRLRNVRVSSSFCDAVRDLMTAAKYLRARLYGTEFQGIEEDETELPEEIDEFSDNDSNPLIDGDANLENIFHANSQTAPSIRLSHQTSPLSHLLLHTLQENEDEEFPEELSC